MALSKEFTDHLRDRFAVVPDTTIRSMFGGAGIFRDGLMFALATSDGRIALKADAETIPDFLAEGSEEWRYEHKSRGAVSMGYWYLPEAVLDDPEQLRRWSENAFEAAKRADAKKPPAKRKYKA